jgi:uncharacterized membrane protein YkvA (DUF1232 family)
MNKPEELTPDQKARAREDFERIRKNIGRKDVEKALAETVPKLKKLAGSDIGWMVKFGKQVKLLFGMLKETWRGDYDLPWKTVASVAAALLYFINPLDIVPDFIPVVGYLDDAMVVFLAVNFVKEDLLAYARSRNLQLEDYGLEKD